MACRQSVSKICAAAIFCLSHLAGLPSFGGLHSEGGVIPIYSNGLSTLAVWIGEGAAAAQAFLSAEVRKISAA
jgi:hypothetical protein